MDAFGEATSWHIAVVDVPDFLGHLPQCISDHTETFEIFLAEDDENAILDCPRGGSDFSQRFVSVLDTAQPRNSQSSTLDERENFGNERKRGRKNEKHVLLRWWFFLLSGVLVGFVKKFVLCFFGKKCYNCSTMNTPKKRFVIIDGNAIIHRAYHAIPPLTGKDGKLTNAVYGFTSMLLKVLADLKPDYIAVAFDVAGGTFRDEVYDQYKATRVKADQDLYDQIPLVHELVRGFGIQVLTKEGFEADDVIGTLVKREEIKRGDAMECVVVSGDKDLLQLVDDHIHVYLLKKGLSEMEMYTPAKVVERFGFAPIRMIDYKAIAGDSSDNIPGVRGIGEKGAKDLLEKIGGVKEIYEALQKDRDGVVKQIRESVVKKLEEDEKGARMSYELATIRLDVPDVEVPIEDCKYVGVDREKVLPLFQQFGFVSLLKRLPGGDAAASDSSTEKSSAGAASKAKKTKALEVISVTPKNFEIFFNNLEKEKVFGCKEILQGQNIFEGKMTGFVFATQKHIYFLDVAVLGEKELKDVYTLFTDKKKILVGHDVKQLVKVLQHRDVKLENTLFDLMIASYVLNSSTRAHDLTSIVLRELGEELVVQTKETLFGIDPSAFATEIGYFLPLFEIYKEALEKDANRGLFDKVEMELIPVLAHMEVAGVAVDKKMLEDLSKDVAEALDVVIRKIWEYAGHEFNVASSVQLRDVLFEEMGLQVEGIKKGKTGFSTAASELDKLRGVHPIIECIEEHRELAKLQNTYIDVLPTLINPVTHRIHSSFNQAVAATGRLSGSDPNLQNIPIRTELGKKIRDAFWSEEGNVLIAADYSQIELRIVASMAEDKKMIEIFKKGDDIHTATAAAINNVPLNEVTKDMRRAAKEVNFGVLYGMGSFGLASRTGISVAEAKEFIEKYFEQFAGVKKYMDETLRVARETGYVETLFGRKRYIPDLNASNFQLRSAAERMAVNMPIQGTAADLMKMAMIAVYENIKDTKDVKIIMQVHDELVLEVKKGLEDEISEMLVETMVGVVQLKVPVEVSVGVGRRWGEIK